MAMPDYILKMQRKYKFFSIFIDLYEILFLFSEAKNPRKALASKIPNKNLRVLDVCFGTGNGSIAIAETKNIIVGIDLSFDMLVVANKKILKQGIQNVFIHQMDAANMGFHDEKFDVVTVSFGLHDMDYNLMMAVLEEIFRVLKKEGRLYIVDYEKEGGFIKRTVFSIYLRISYPQRVQEFLKYDWSYILSNVGFRFDKAEEYMISKLICATKLSG
jgi:ubiquinone/menaquinone biosynthesis C-methylase UbiE